MTKRDPLLTLFREVILAVAMISIIVIALWVHTGSMPPLVVVESSSMVHDPKGEIGSIDAGDLILVHDQKIATVITFAEATDPKHIHFQYETHGMPGDVIIFQKNGENTTPIIHRAILKASANLTTLPDNEKCDSGVYDDSIHRCILTWDVPGTQVRNATSINITFDGINAPGIYSCNIAQHNEMVLEIVNWKPKHIGFLTLGDNNNCNVDQGNAARPMSSGISSSAGVVGAVKESWIVGVAGYEIPWLGVVKLFVSGDDSPGVSYVPNSSFVWLFTLIGIVLFTPAILEPSLKRIMKSAPEISEAEREDALEIVLSEIRESE